MEVDTEEVTVQHVDRLARNAASGTILLKLTNKDNQDKNLLTWKTQSQLWTAGGGSCCRKPTNQMKNLGGNEDQGQR